MEHGVTRSLHLVVAGALAASFLLTGCGRKGPLDPPPGAWVTPQGGTPHPQAQQQAQPSYGPDGKPVAPTGPNRRLPGDWLID